MSALVFHEFDQYGILSEAPETVDLFVSISLNREEANPTGHRVQNVLTDVHSKQSTNVFESIMEQCVEIAGQLGVHPLVAFMLLATQGWNLHRLAEKWASISGVLLSQIGVSPECVLDDPSLRHPPEALKPEDGWVCAICFCPCETEDMWCLPCGHTFCTGCWKFHVETKVSEADGQPKCMQEGCKCVIPPNSVKDLCEPDVYENLLKFLVDQQVSLADTLTFCPNPHCSKAIDIVGMTLCNTVTCAHCLHEFCGECREPSHAPATCSEKQQWEAFTDEEVMKQRLFGENVKTCPNCKCIIEKNKGCNHMTCWKCHHEFCWLCMKPWSSHPKTYYECAEYKKENDPFLKKPDNVNRELLEKYNEVFLKRGLIGRSMKEKMTTNVEALARVVELEQGLTRSDITQCVTELYDQLYWANENLRWAQVHMFVMRFDSVKQLPPERQLNAAMKTETAELHCFTFNVGQLEQVYTRVTDKIASMCQGRPCLFDIFKLTRELKLYREVLLKQCDPFYA